MTKYRIGLDIGGTKVEIAAIGPDGNIAVRRRISTPGGEASAIYDKTVIAVAELIKGVDAELGEQATVGAGIPGVISPATGLVKNANSVALNGHPLDKDLSAALGREVRVANDANCFALSEAVDGAAAGKKMVFGVIVGTGVGAGLIYDRNVIVGPHAVAGEWGHNPLPWMTESEFPGNKCWCGLNGCIETYLSGPSLARDCDGPEARDASSIVGRAAAGEQKAIDALERHAERLARSLAQIINVLDPDAIVLGGGLSNMEHLYKRVPELLSRHVFSDTVTTPILQNKHGDSSGVRGAAWLWPA